MRNHKFCNVDNVSSSVNIPAAKSVERPIMDLVIRLLYWQGFWLQPPDTNLEFFHKYFKRRLPKLVYFLPRRRYLRFFRPFYALFVMVFLFLHLFVVYPFGLLSFRGNKTEVIENTFAILFCFLGLSGLVTLFFGKPRLFVLISKLQELSRCKLFGDEASRRTLRKTDVICHTLTKYVHLVFVPFMSGSLVVYVCFVLLPGRKMFFRGWFPYDNNLSPAFEITLFIWTIGCISAFAIVNTIVCFYCATFVYIIVYFNILVRKFKTTSTKISNHHHRHHHHIVRRRRIIETSRIKNVIASRLIFERSRVDFVLDETRNDHLDCKYFQNERSDVKLNLPGVVESENLESKPFDVSKCFEQRSKAEIGSKRTELNYQPTKMNTRRVLIPTEQYQTRNEGMRSTSNLIDVRKDYNLKIFEIVKFHQEILRCTVDWFSIMNMQMIVSFLTSMGTLGSTTLLVTAASSFSMKELFLISLFLEAEFMFFLFNVMANEITIEAAAVGEAVYACDWLRASPLFKQTMLIVMSQAHHPLVMKPPGLNPFSRTMFGDVSYTAFKILRTMNTLFT